MQPLWGRGAVVEVQPTGGPCGLGEIVAVWLPGEERLLVHRIVGRDEAGRILTRGDHLAELDPPHLAENVLGRVTRIEQAGQIFDLTTRRWQGLNARLGQLAHWQMRLGQLTQHYPILMPFRKAATLVLNTSLQLAARYASSWLGQPQSSLEISLTIECLQPDFGLERIAVLRQLAATSGFDWQAVARFAALHEVTPLVFNRLLTLDPPILPTEIQAQFETLLQSHIIKSLILTRDLLAVVASFQERHIPVLSFKGPALAQQIYGDVALREFHDLDLLIESQDLLKAKALLLEQGFRPEFELDDAEQLRYALYNYEEWFRQAASKRIVDLHWSLLPTGYSFWPDPAMGWERQVSVELGNGLVAVPGPEVMVLYLSFHGAKHGWNSWQLLTDLAHFLNTQPDLDWSWIEAHAGQLGSRRMWLLGLYLAHRLLEVPLPPIILNAFASDSALPGLFAQLKPGLVGWPVVRPAIRSGFARYWRGLADWYDQERIYRQTLPTLGDRLHYWRTNLLQPTPLEWAQTPLPPSLFWLYYLLRPARLLLKFARRGGTGR